MSENFDCLEVTAVQIYPFDGSQLLGNLRALVTVVLNDQLLVRGLRVMDGENGLYVGYPNDPFYKGEDFRTIVSPITKKLRDCIESVVLEQYSYINDEVSNG